MAANLKINVILHSGKNVLFENILPGKAYSAQQDGVRLTVGRRCPAPVTVVPPAGTTVKSIEYDLFTDMANYYKVIIPESGRGFINMTQLISFWRLATEASVADFKMPLYIFTGQDLNMAMAFGVIGLNYETSFRCLEPRTNRALIAFMRRLSMRIKRGTDLYPIPDHIARKNPDGSVTEHLYFQTAKDAPRQPWAMTLRDFAEHQKRIYKVPDVGNEGSMAPLWCSWTDWFSDDVTDKVILHNVREGVKLGIRNYIIDDGWFGPGLDNDYDVQLNIGDWRPDPAKIKDMGQLVRDVKAEGAMPMIWCAPHAVAPGAECFPRRRPYLLVDEKGELVMTKNKFHSLCFMCPEAREIMAEICASFIREWDFEGAKYDLFNCVPNNRCCSSEHSHDVTSMMEGLHRTLGLIDRRTRALKKDYIVELKQNYGTPFLSQFGTMTRAGDTPYNSEGNFLRTLYVQGYSPFAINDYQTITEEDSPQAAACIVLKMMSVGIPTYSIDFARLNQDNKDVIAHYNNLYNRNVGQFMRYRVPLDGENNVFRLPGRGKQHDLVFLVNSGGNCEITRPTTILNGTFNKDMFVRRRGRKTATVTNFDCFGKKRGAAKNTTLDGWTHLDLLPGGMTQIDF
ncbi:MAG: alpha-galactosidase [Phycisphaerae bacterium]